MTKAKIVVNSVLAEGKHRLTVFLGRQKSYGITFSPDLDAKQLDLALNSLVDNITKKELGFNKTDLILKLGKLYEV